MGKKESNPEPPKGIKKPKPPPLPPPKRIINEDVKLFSRKTKPENIKSQVLKNHINSLPKLIIYVEEFDDIEESGRWLLFPTDFELLFKVYKNNEKAIIFIKNTLKKAKEDFEIDFISLIGK